MFIIRNSIGCGQCLRPKMLSDIFSFLFTLFLPNWLLISIRIYSGIARFPCDSMAFLSTMYTCYHDLYFYSHHPSLSTLSVFHSKFITCLLSNISSMVCQCPPQDGLLQNWAPTGLSVYRLLCFSFSLYFYPVFTTKLAHGGF